MKLTLNKHYIIGLFCGILPALHGQTLGEMVKTALEKNYQILILENESTIAQNNNTAGNAGQLPTVDLNGTASTSLNNTRQLFADGTVREGTNASTSNINLSLMANWTVFNGFSVWAKKDQLGYLEELGLVNAKFYIEQTVADIALAYYQLIYEQQVLANYEESLNISSYRLSLEKKKREVGSGKGIEYHQAVVDYQSDSIRLFSQQNIIKTLQIELNRIMVNDLEEEWFIDDTTFNATTLPAKDSLMDLVNQHNQQLAQSKLQELVAETEIRLQKAAKSPKVDIFAGGEYNRSLAEVGFVNSNRNLGPTAGVTISFNLYNGGNTNRLIKNAQLESRNATLSRQQVENNVSADMLKYYYQYESVLARIALAEGNVVSAKKVYAIAQNQLKQGAINGYDFRQTQLTLLSAELALAQLYFESHSVEINIKRLSGQVLASYL